MKNEIDILIKQMEEVPYWAFCQLLAVIRWQMY